MNEIKVPKTLQEAIIYFSDESRAFEFFKTLRWSEGVTCPACGCKKSSFISTRKAWRCSDCRLRFTIKQGTIFEESPLPLSKWLPAVWLIINAKNGISSYEIHRALGVTQKTAWFMLHRIRLAMEDGTIEKIGGHVEADETYIGGRARRIPGVTNKRGRGAPNKTAVMGVLERGEKVITAVAHDVSRKTLQGFVLDNVEGKSKLYTDAFESYTGLNREYEHQIVDHAVEYVSGHVHTNGLENYWSLLKRTIRGTYVSVEPFHLFRYLGEQSFRYNERRDTDGERFMTALAGIVGRRLTYRNLTGKELLEQA